MNKAKQDNKIDEISGTSEKGADKNAEPKRPRKMKFMTKLRKVGRKIAKVYLPVYNFLAEFLKTFKLELIIMFIGIALAYGQYIQNITDIRINVTRTWRDGYNENVRNRVSKYIVFYKKWVNNCGRDQECLKGVQQTLETLVRPERIYFGKIEDDLYIQGLICEDLRMLRSSADRVALGKAGSESNVPPDEFKGCNLEGAAEPTKDDVIQAVMKYRNAIIECLNTAEAVKAVMEAKPYLKQDIIYKDTLPGRYRDIILELRNDLTPFIDTYRNFKTGRETEAWFVLTQEESGENERLLLKRLGWIIGIVLGIMLVLRLLALLFRYASTKSFG